MDFIKNLSFYREEYRHPYLHTLNTKYFILRFEYVHFLNLAQSYLH
jgi:hypothetical protein